MSRLQGCLSFFVAWACRSVEERRKRRPVNSKLVVATQARRNSRPYMEDSTQLATWNNDPSHVLHGWTMLAVFDGHGGEDAANWLAENVGQQIEEVAISLYGSGTRRHVAKCNGSERILDPPKIEKLLRHAFFEIDQKLRLFSESACWPMQGATAVIVLISDSHVVSANIGDARALLWSLDSESLRQRSCPHGNATSLIDLSTDHKPGDKRERRRIERSPGFRVVGQMECGVWVDRILPAGWDTPNVNLSRAFGDFHCKPNSARPSSNPITVEPHIRTVALDLVGNSHDHGDLRKAFLLILASDGVVNEAFDSNKVFSVVEEALRNEWQETAKCGADFITGLSREDWNKFARALLTASETSNLSDNQSVHIAFIDQLYQDPHAPAIVNSETLPPPTKPLPHLLSSLSSGRK